jgi:flagellin
MNGEVTAPRVMWTGEDGRRAESGESMQSYIDRLMQELDRIAGKPSSGNTKLFSGRVTGKSFHSDAGSWTTRNPLPPSVLTGRPGNVPRSILSLTDNAPGIVELGIYSSALDQAFLTERVDVLFDNSAVNSIGAVADAINDLADKLGLDATAVVQSTTSCGIQAGSPEGLAINGIPIDENLDVKANDSDGALVLAINSRTASHGVVASVDASGILTLASIDNRAIRVTGGRTLFSGQDMSTMGHVLLTGPGADTIRISDLSGESRVILTDSPADTGVPIRLDEPVEFMVPSFS